MFVIFILRSVGSFQIIQNSYQGLKVSNWWSRIDPTFFNILPSLSPIYYFHTFLWGDVTKKIISNIIQSQTQLSSLSSLSFCCIIMDTYLLDVFKYCSKTFIWWTYISHPTSVSSTYSSTDQIFRPSLNPTPLKIKSLKVSSQISGIALLLQRLVLT